MGQRSGGSIPLRNSGLAIFVGATILGSAIGNIPQSTARAPDLILCVLIAIEHDCGINEANYLAKLSVNNGRLIDMENEAEVVRVH